MVQCFNNNIDRFISPRKLVNISREINKSRMFIFDLIKEKEGLMPVMFREEGSGVA